MHLITGIVLIICLLLHYPVFAAPSLNSVQNCDVEAAISADSRSQLRVEIRHLPDGIYKWDSAAVYLEKYAVDGTMLARMNYYEVRNSDNTTQSEISCLQGLHKQSAVKSLRFFVPAITTLLIEKQEISAFNLRSFLLTVDDKIRGNSRALELQKGLTLQEYFRVANLDPQLYRVGDKYQIRINKQVNDGVAENTSTLATVIVELSFQP